MKYLGSYRFTGTDGSMGLRRGAVYDLLLEKNQLDVYHSSRGFDFDDESRPPIHSLEYTVEAFIRNWKKVGVYEI